MMRLMPWHWRSAIFIPWLRGENWTWRTSRLPELPKVSFNLMNKLSAFSVCFLLLWSSSPFSEEQVPLKFVWHKTIHGGSIESYGLELGETGKGKFSFKRREEDPLELDFELKPAKVEALLSCFVRADFFNETKNFVSPRKVADMGLKTVRFESGTRKREVTFNYTEDRTMMEIVDFFENLCQQEKSLFEMDLALKYDRLGIPKKLDELERNLTAKRIVDPERFAPVLEKIYLDESLMNLARTEAKKILSKIEKMQTVAN
jgi:hypothetical protein